MAMSALTAGLWKINFSSEAYDFSSKAFKPTIGKT